MKGLEHAIGMTVIDPIRDERGWRFSSDFPDPVNSWDFLSEGLRPLQPLQVQPAPDRGLPEPQNHLRDLCQVPGVAEAVDWDHISALTWHPQEHQPEGVIPAGPVLDLEAPAWSRLASRGGDLDRPRPHRP